MIDKNIGIDLDEYMHRAELKRFYNTPTGIHVLSQKILMSGLLSEIPDEEGRLAHNLAVKELEEIGILDEEALEGLIKFLLTTDTKHPQDS